MNHQPPHPSMNPKPTPELAQMKPVRLDQADPNRKAALGDSVLMTYECRLDDGTPFDRSPV